MSNQPWHVQIRDSSRGVPRSQPSSQGRFLLRDVGAATAKGHAHKENEDHYLVAELRRPIDVTMTSVGRIKPARDERSDPVILLAVADGVTAEGGGSIASATALSSLVSGLAEGWQPLLRSLASQPRGPQESIPEVRHELGRVFRAGDEGIRRVAARDQRAPHMGTTLTLAWLRPPTAYVAHVGDSRCYLLREGALHQVTRDHTIAAVLAEAGQMTEPDSRLHNILSRVLGGAKENDHRPDVQRILLAPRDTLLLASDGVAAVLEPEVMRRVLLRDESAQGAATQLVEQSRQASGRDDMTAVVARF